MPSATIQHAKQIEPANTSPITSATKTGVTAPKSSILETIGNTPIVRLNHVGPSHVELFAKLEFFNPMGSVKDRLAVAAIERAEASGELKPGQTVIEATSGNTGIGLAMVCAQKGYPLVIVMAENFSLERRKLLRFLGAKVILSSASIRGTGMFRIAEALAEKHGWFLCRQFENEANADIHSKTTAREILEVFPHNTLDFWVTGFGTGGTLKGVSRTLKSTSPWTQVVLAEPENSQLMSSGVSQARRPDGVPARSHPNSRAHPIQGWSPDFIPKLAEDAVDGDCIDVFQPVSGADGLRVAKELARREGIFCGVSGGATVAAAIALANTAPNGAKILAMVPDTGERYLSTPLFEDIGEAMSDEERGILESVPMPSPPKSAGVTKSISPEAAAFVHEVIHDPDHPVVMFGFEWCEFCWSVRRVFGEANVPFRTIDVDSTAYRQGDWGGEVLRALFHHTKMRTVPQVFIGGTLVGGATDVLTDIANGKLPAQLAALPDPIHATPVADPMDYLPKWLGRQKPTQEAVR